MLNRLTLTRAERPARNLGGGACQTGRVYADFVVDGKPLSEIAARYADLVSPLGWGPAPWQDAIIAQLLGESPPPLPDGRQPLYVCPECGDLACGAVTAIVERDGDWVIWRDFGFETGLDIDPEDLDRPKFADVGPFRFNRAEYEAAIRAELGMRQPAS